MTDIKIQEYFSLEGVTMDFLLTDAGLLDEREEMATSVRVALGTDRLAAIDEVLPDLDSTDRHGWWGDLDAEEIWGGWSIGCKNWLLSRSKITDALSVEGSTLARAKRYTQEALQPFIDKRVATRIEVSAVRTELERIVVEAKIYRGPTAEIDLRYQLLWQEDLREDAQSIESNNKNIRVPYRNLILSTTKPQEIFKPKGELILSRFAPSVDRGKKFSPPSGNLILSSIAPKAASYDLSPPNANLIISSINPTRSP